MYIIPNEMYKNEMKNQLRKELGKSILNGDLKKAKVIIQMMVLVEQMPWVV